MKASEVRATWKETLDKVVRGETIYFERGGVNFMIQAYTRKSYDAFVETSIQPSVIEEFTKVTKGTIKFKNIELQNHTRNEQGKLDKQIVQNLVGDKDELTETVKLCKKHGLPVQPGRTICGQKDCK